MRDVRLTVRFPALFVSHGSPMEAVEESGWARDLAAWASGRAKPRAVLVVSGHWQTPSPVRVTGSPSPETIHDFDGFPDELYRIRYRARGDPALASMVARLLEEAGIPARKDPDRGLDHGAWVPLRRLYPEADVPVVEVSLPLRRNPEDALRMGAALSRLRDESVLLLGTGGIVHNLARMEPNDDSGRVAEWARVFDAWIADRLEAMDAAGIAAYRSLAPQADLAVPTPEHFDPIFVVLGSAIAGERVTTIHDGFRYGSVSMRTFAVG